MNEQEQRLMEPWKLEHNQGMIPKDSILLRDQFAMAALTGLLARQTGLVRTPRMFAIEAYDMAREMLAERDKKR